MNGRYRTGSLGLAQALQVQRKLNELQATKPTAGVEAPEGVTPAASGRQDAPAAEQGSDGRAG